MAVSLRPKHLKRYKDVAWLLMKYGDPDIVQRVGLEAALEDEIEPPGDGKAEELAADLERLGPTYIKLGQLLSTRADLLPPAYMHALSRLQDDVEPFSFAEVEPLIQRELGIRISKAFEFFEAEPIAAASLGQVHLAGLHDGRRVAVKVQRPKIRQRISEDLEAFDEIADLLDRHTEWGKQYEFHVMLDEFKKTIFRELDYNREAQNLLTLKKNLEEFELIVVPGPIDDYTTSQVLTMEYLKGKKITELSPLVRTELDVGRLADELFRAYLKQILVDGFFHADPHPGNVFVSDDGRIALLDLGMVARLTPRLQQQLLKLLLAISEGRGEEAAEVSLEISETRDVFNRREYFRRASDLINENRTANIEDLQVGTIVMQVTAIAADCGVRVPPELTMLGKTLLNLDEAARTLDPTFNPTEAVQRHASEIMNQRLKKSLSPGSLFTGLLDLKEFLDHLPDRANKILEKLANNEVEIKVNAIDETQLMEGFQKIANRITVGLVVAALIIGAAMLMQVQTAWQIGGYPALAIILFLLAAGAGVALLMNIMFSDKHSENK